MSAILRVWIVITLSVLILGLESKVNDINEYEVDDLDDKFVNRELILLNRILDLSIEKCLFGMRKNSPQKLSFKDETIRQKKGHIW
jgi:hypothetical protein